MPLLSVNLVRWYQQWRIYLVMCEPSWTLLVEQLRTIRHCHVMLLGWGWWYAMTSAFTMLSSILVSIGVLNICITDSFAAPVGAGRQGNGTLPVSSGKWTPLKVGLANISVF